MHVIAEITQTQGAQSPETKDKRSGRNRRLSGVMPELRDRIQPLFHRGVAVERIAEDLDVSPLQLLEHVVRVYCGAKQPGPFLMGAAQRGSVREQMHVLRRTA